MLATCIGLFVALIVIVIVANILNGFVLSVLWGWFIVPLFGLPPLSIPSAIGVALVVGLLTHQMQKGKETEKTGGFITASIGELLSPLIVLAVGWIVHMFV